MTQMEDFHINQADLIRLQAELRRKNLDAFIDIIFNPTRSLLLNIDPLIFSDDTIVKDIIVNVFRRLKNDSRNTSFETVVDNFKQKINQYLKREIDLAMPTESNRAKNFGMTKKEFQVLVNKLKNGDEELIEKVFLKHVESCELYLKNHLGCSAFEAHDSTIDALIDIRKDLIKDKISYGNLRNYFTRRAILIFNKKGRKEKTQPIDDLEINNDVDLERDVIDKEFNAMIRKSIEQMCGDCRNIIKRFYFDEESLKNIAGEMDKTYGSIRKKIERCRDELRGLIEVNFKMQS